jgi:ferrous iron transport protein B
MIHLSDLQQGDKAFITKVRGRGAFRKRITEMGFIKGKEVRVVKAAPLQDPVEYQVMGSHVSLRRSEAGLIEVDNGEFLQGEILLNNLKHTPESDSTSSISVISPAGKEKVIDIVLVGNPNCGKTTLFNLASGSRERVGNFGGVTVDSKEATFQYRDYRFNITDLPGTYSLTAYSPEELYVRKHILERVPDIVVNVLDGANLERNLYLTTQLIDMDIRVVISLNMYDDFLRSGGILKHEELGKLLGIPIIPTVASKGEGLSGLFDCLIDVYEDRNVVVRHVHINYGQELERSLSRIQQEIRKDKSLTDRVSSRYFSIKLLEKDWDIIENQSISTFRKKKILEVADTEITRLETTFKDDSATLITDAKYGFIAGALRETMTPALGTTGKTTSEKIDNLLTNKYLGFPLFIFFLWLMFQTTFTLGSYPQDWIEAGVNRIGSLVHSLLPPGPIKDLLTDGIIHGIGSVIVFLPNILILFFFISLMEDTGYMARAAFIMDKVMHKMGLHGQSFIPLIMGFGCNVPAIMVTRTLKDRNDRLLTMLINPFMSCSARLPVYILITGAVFPDNAGNVIFLLYLTGIILAVIISLIFKKLIFKSQEAPFVMELPPYRMPTIRVITMHIWEKGKQYLSKMGGIILIAVVLIWALEYFPGGASVTPEKRLEQSYIARIGKAIEPVIAPLGFDWRMGISLMTGAAAKEVVVSTMGVLFGHEPDPLVKDNDLTLHLRHATYQAGDKAGQPLFTPLTGFSFLLFILIYMPCVAVMAAVGRESGHWKWALFLVTYTTILAWVLSFAVYQIGSLFIG